MQQTQELSGLAADFLSGGGEMGRRLRSHDWSATPLGRPDSWAVSLQAAVKLLLAARSPIAVGWGPDLLMLHNDAYTGVTSATGPSRVGLPFRQLSPELWQRVGPLVERAMQNGETALLENQLFCMYRNGYAEETYLSFCCNPMADRGAGVQGVMVMITETTEQVIGARRTAALRDISGAGAAAHSVEDACRQALDAISRHSTDIPFALLYVRDSTHEDVRLVAASALAAGTPASPHVLAFDAGAVSWPIAAALENNRTVVVDDLPTRFEALPAGNWPLAPRCAVIVPLTTPGRNRPDGVLIVGVSARHECDASYLDFVDLVASHVTAAMTGGRLREGDAKRRARLRALKARFAGVMEERTRLAREIHDTLLQGVTGIALQLRAALPHLQASSEEQIVALEQIAALAEKTSRDARKVVWDMRPNALNEHEFARAVESAARQTMAGTEFVLRVLAKGRARRVHADAQAVVLRIVQEAVANVVRHASATTITVTISFGARQLRAAITDDGRGFAVEPDFHSYTGHWGLVGMVERAEQLGGSLRVRSAPGEGTTVTLNLPLRPSRALQSPTVS
ncbi:MAG: sensor hybrid histidine kinase [Gemmatimonadetes bacterium]|nr:sensor hybrid histidine kinase [Gemmatimonadota bacterium]